MKKTMRQKASSNDAAGTRDAAPGIQHGDHTAGTAAPTAGPTQEVGSEGGTPGDVDVHRDHAPGVGSEAGETWRPADRTATDVARDETGRGRRSP
jgi:hypothetical protein